MTCAKLTFDTDDLAEGMAALIGLELSGQSATFRMAQSVESGASREVSIMPSQYKEVHGRMVRIEQKRLFLEDPMIVISERAEQVQQPQWLMSVGSHTLTTMLHLLTGDSGAAATNTTTRQLEQK